jgi:hypothetical protein
MQSGAGEVTGSERFVRGNRQPGQFVGADTSDLSTTIFGSMAEGGGGAGGGPLAGLANLGASRDGNSAGNRGGRTTGRGGGGQRRINYSMGLEVGFDYAQPPQTAVSARIEERLAKMTRIRRYGSLRVTMEGRTATIRGAVASAHEREIVGNLVMFEPGVSLVRNELTVGPPASPAEAPQPPAPPNP